MGQIHSLTSDEAQVIMGAAMYTLKARVKVASVVIVNRDGMEIVKVVMDNIKPFTVNVASLKAKQSVWTGKPTSKIRDEVDAGEKTLGVLGIDPDNFIPWAGGVPIYDKNDHLLGGIGVSNLAQEEDEMVAESAVCKAGFKTSAN